MLPSSLLVGLLAALCNPAHGLVFRDKIKQAVGGDTLYLHHDIEDATSVRFSKTTDSATLGWKFDTEGFADDEAVITPLDSSKTLVCELDKRCTLELDGLRQPYRLARVDQTQPIFTFQDIASGLYVSRTDDLGLELTGNAVDTIYFELEAIRDSNAQI
ncbi:hypothetical protein ANOM_008483 [Aspergillus nomiae NRRL 13137]|uniref:Uncharacterized protein n=1 Tax=Aspergillus nomiae NRRL (strain ATCC 15546 / NRRL 13137 / CBS 260.88 / M93) TaxID=1509407 RepID=A0A0L1IVX8_ASPN3|nr:uncharacterized protein ANOM_008483 [Aspergillus nomiae NRRL 13137]KNG83647.1 hypothetical protein ANOM_008483 [Aspergillus nomiae NRRL 13137]